MWENVFSIDLQIYLRLVDNINNVKVWMNVCMSMCIFLKNFSLIGFNWLHHFWEL